MTAGSFIKYNKPKLFSELQLIAFCDAGETRKNKTKNDIALRETLIINLTINEQVLFRKGKKYSRVRRDRNITIKTIAAIIGDKELKFILLYSVSKKFTTAILFIKKPGLSLNKYH